MSVWQLSALSGGVVGAVVLVVLVVVTVRLVTTVARLDRTTGELRLALDELRGQTAGLVERHDGDGAASVERGASVASGASIGSGNGSRAAVDVSTASGSAAGGSAAGGVDRTGRLAFLGLASPLIKARALGTGTSRAAHRLRERRER